MPLKLVTGPSSQPVSDATVKAHLRVDDTDSDPIIKTYIAAATSYLDGLSGILGRAIVSQTWEYYCDEFPCGDLEIPLGPLVSVATVEYIDPVSGNYATWGSANYTVDNISEPGKITAVDSWPTAKAVGNAVRVTFTAGFGDESKVPAAIKAALLLLIGDMYENRENTVVGQSVEQMPIAVKALLAPFRRQIV